MRFAAAVTALAVSAACTCGPGGVTDAGVPDGGAFPPDDGGRFITTLFVIVMENKNWKDVRDSGAAPYLNGTLLRIGAHAENYQTQLHPSEPNYLLMEAGDNFGIRDDKEPSVNHQATTDHLVNQLEDAGIRWRSYQEGITGTSCPLTGSGNYAPKHNPMVFFDDVTANNDATSARCLEHVRPYAELWADLDAGTVSGYNFLTPDLCDDGHNDCGDGGILQTDTWLSTEVPKLMASSAYQNGGAIFVTWDEGAFTSSCPLVDCPIGFIVVSPVARAGYQNSIAYDHLSLLRTMQTVFRVGPYLRGAATATDLRDLFAHY